MEKSGSKESEKGNCPHLVNVLKGFERFEFYFFLYFLSFSLTSRLNSEYINSLAIADFYKSKATNLTFTDDKGQPVPINPEDVVIDTCAHLTSRDDVEERMLRVHAHIAYYEMLTEVAFLIPSILVTIVFGIVSDFRGKRKIALTTGCVSTTIYSLVLIWHYYKGGTLTSLVGTAVISGCFGYRTAAIIALIAYVADVTERVNRFQVMGISVMLMKLAFAITDGPVSYWIHRDGFQEVIWTTFAVNYFVFKLTIHIMQESQSKHTEYRSSNLWLFLHWFSQMTTKDDDTQQSMIRAIFHKHFNLILAGFCSITFILKSVARQLNYFGLSQYSCAKPAFQGMFLDINVTSLLSTAMNFAAFLGSFCIVLILIKHKREIPYGLVGLVLTAGGLLFLPFADSTLLFLLGNVSFMSSVSWHLSATKKPPKAFTIHV